MSMLAERKRKQKWSLNPRGKDWAQDANKFGQKMLEKMGWQHGKGLGAKEDGITEHIKVSYKNDSKGMGFKEANDQWTKHETNFSALLESLSGSVAQPEDIKVRSLEKKSESSRVRVHYHKFTRGKDLSRYSEKDLANIFGKKSLKEPKKQENKSEPVDDNTEKMEKESIFLVNAGSMKDYFKKKLPSFGKGNGYVVGSNGVLKTGDSDSENDFRPSFSCMQNADREESNQYAGFGFGSETAKKNSSFISYISKDNTGEVRKTKKRIKVGEMEETPKKKSRKEAEDTSKDVQIGCFNPAFNPMFTPVKVEKHILTTIEETFSEDILEIDNSAIETVTNEVTPKDTLKKKKKKCLTEDFSNLGNEESSSRDMSLEDGNTKKHKTNKNLVETEKRDKKKKKKELGTENTAFNEQEISTESNESSQSRTNPFEIENPDGKKKKKRKKNKEIGTENPAFNVLEMSTSPNVSQDGTNPFEIENEEGKIKKKKKRFAIENPIFNESNESSGNSSLLVKENPYEVKMKKKKKQKSTLENSAEESLEDLSQGSLEETKKKEKKYAAAVENSAFDDSVNDSVEVSVDHNVFEVKRKKKRKADLASDNLPFDSLNSQEDSYEVKRKKKKNKDKLAAENPAFDEFSQTEESINESSGNKEENNTFEVERKKKKSKKNKEEAGIANPCLDLETSLLGIAESDSIIIEESSLMLNVVTTPILSKPRMTNCDETFSITKVNSVKRRKSVRFSDVTQEHIIPNNDDLRNLDEVSNNTIEEQTSRENGLDNLAFDKQKNRVEENLLTISNTLDRYQAEIENDINEKKIFTVDDIMVGEVGNPHGDNERLENGTKLKFKHAQFLTSKTPSYQLDKVGPKKGYRHLIKGDIVVKFNNTNLHEINGYAIKNKKPVL